MQGLIDESAKVATKVEPKVEVTLTHKRSTVRFLKNIPAIMGADMKSYGPFVAEDVASLPPQNAQILVKQGLAVLVEVS
jgi:DNA replication initiation complex subunit (GINS family)